MQPRHVPHSINIRPAVTKAEKCGLIHTMSENLFYFSRKRKKDKLKPKWEGAFIIDEVLTGGAYRLRNEVDNCLEPNPWNVARLQRLYA